MPRRKVILESRLAPPDFSPSRPSSDALDVLGGIYAEDRRAFIDKQEQGLTIAPLTPKVRYADDWQKPQSDEKPIFQGRPRDVRLKAGIDSDGNIIAPHYQREWLRVNPKGLTHDLIHLAVMRVMRRSGFMAEVIYPKLFSSDEGGEWSYQTRIEEAIVDALELAGIREGKISENFWEALESVAEYQGVEPPLLTYEQVADIAKEVDYLSAKSLENDHDESDDFVHTPLY